MTDTPENIAPSANTNLPNANAYGADSIKVLTVSYTHLTLPTKRIV